MNANRCRDVYIRRPIHFTLHDGAGLPAAIPLVIQNNDSRHLSPVPLAFSVHTSRFRQVVEGVNIDKGREGEVVGCSASPC